MRILGIDLGDRWVGLALSDPLGMTCAPFKTSEWKNFLSDLYLIIKKESVSLLVVGLPITLAGNESDQTARVRDQVAQIQKYLAEKKCDSVAIEFFDERLSSKWAQQKALADGKQKDKNYEHARAAAFILQNFLDRRAFLAEAD